MQRASRTVLFVGLAFLLLSGCAGEHRDAAETATLPDDRAPCPAERPHEPSEVDRPIVPPEEAPSEGVDVTTDTLTEHDSPDTRPDDIRLGEVEPPDAIPLHPSPGESLEPTLPQLQPSRDLRPSMEVAPLAIPSPLSLEEPDRAAPKIRSFNPIRDQADGSAAELSPGPMMLRTAPEVQVPESTAAPLLPLEAAGDPVIIVEPEPEVERPYTLVRVFYGTDRNALAAPVARRSGFLGWAALTACGATATLLLGLATLRSQGGRAFRRGAVASFACTVLLGGITLYSGLQGRLAETAEQSELDPNAVTRAGYGNQRGAMEYGICEVSIPKGHKVGQLEAPSIFRLEFRETPERHVVLRGVEPLESEAFFGALRARVEDSDSQSAFVFVHGFNVTFEDAARRTAQIAYDLKFDGAPIFYSWPSQGGLFKYTIDETNVTWTVPHLRQFLTDVAERSGARRIHLVAHSMGNRALTAALRDLSFLTEEKRPRFNEIVLTAPDIDAEVFKKDIAPYIVQTADRVTLYASSNDTALAYSKTVHGYPRAGDSGRQLLVLPGMDTVDVSEIDTSLLGHSYYGSNETVLADLIEVLHKSLPPQQRRWLRPVQVGSLEYWVFQR